MGVGVQRHAPAALPPGKTRYPLYRRLGGPQGRSGQVRKISPPKGFDPRTVQPVASRYTDCVVPAHFRSSYRSRIVEVNLKEANTTTRIAVYWDVIYFSFGIYYQRFREALRVCLHFSTRKTKAASSSEMSIALGETTWSFIPERHSLHSDHRENIRSHVKV